MFTPASLIYLFQAQENSLASIDLLYIFCCSQVFLVRERVVQDDDLTLESERDTDLVGSFVEFLGVEGSTETKSDTCAELDVVGESGKTLIVDLGLCH